MSIGVDFDLSTDALHPASNRPHPAQHLSHAIKNDQRDRGTTHLVMPFVGYDSPELGIAQGIDDITREERGYRPRAVPFLTLVTLGCTPFDIVKSVEGASVVVYSPPVLRLEGESSSISRGETPTVTLVALWSASTLRS